LTLLVVSALLPAQQDLSVLTEQLAKLEHQEKVNQKRIGAYAQFLVELKAKDPSLLTRLAASQLNLMPKGEAPVLVATSMEHTVSDWIEATVPPEAFEPDLVPDTLLTRLASGQRRLWLMGGGALIVFIGLTTGIPLTPSTRLVATALEEKWLEETRTPTNFASESQESVAQVEVDDSPQPLEYDIDLPLETSFEIAAAQPVQQGDADVGVSVGESAEKQLREVSGQGEVVGQWPTSIATESSVAVDDDMADGKWTWDAHANVEPYILISHAESGNSVEGASNVGASGEGEGLWPHAAD
jgi:hypothetical protein